MQSYINVSVPSSSGRSFRPYGPQAIPFQVVTGGFARIFHYPPQKGLPACRIGSAVTHNLLSVKRMRAFHASPGYPCTVGQSPQP